MIHKVFALSLKLNRKKHTQKKRRYALQQINKFSKTKSFAKIIFVFCPLTACGESEEIHMS